MIWWYIPSCWSRRCRRGLAILGNFRWTGAARVRPTPGTPWGRSRRRRRTCTSSSPARSAWPRVSRLAAASTTTHGGWPRPVVRRPSPLRRPSPSPATSLATATAPRRCPAWTSLRKHDNGDIIKSTDGGRRTRPSHTSITWRGTRKVMITAVDIMSVCELNGLYWHANI